MQPTVCAVMLTRDRPAMARRAVECFRAQTYDPASRFMLIWDSGDPSWYDSLRGPTNEQQWASQVVSRATIGALRNLAGVVAAYRDIFVHWDSDDWSHPRRIEEQIATLQASGVDAVGYREMLFWRSTDDTAWMYGSRSFCTLVGSSLCYWREAWERRPFPDLPKPGVKDGSTEDTVWLSGVKRLGEQANIEEPRMICSIHGGNTQSYEIENYPDSWRRVPGMDEYCMRIMKL